MGLLNFVALVFKQVAFLDLVSHAGLDIPHNFQECLRSVQSISNLVVPEAVKLLINKLPLSEHNQEALVFVFSMLMVLAAHLLCQVAKYAVLKANPLFYSGYVKPLFSKPKVSTKFIRSFL